jgi:acetyl esterase
MRLIAERAGIVNYIVGYQLAPEAKYPVQIDEIEYVVRWLFENAAAQGIDRAKIGVGGDSAGGNMTCVIALKLRDENGPRLAVQVPLFPEAAFPADTLAASENRSGLYLESNGIFEMVRNLVKNTDDVRHPYITPLNAESHAGLPPAILVTNGFDPLRDVAHARKLAAAGNDLTYVHNPNLTHGFPQFTRSSAACHQATLEPMRWSTSWRRKPSTPLSWTRSSTWFAGFSIMPPMRVSIPGKSRSAGIPRAGT